MNLVPTLLERDASRNTVCDGLWLLEETALATPPAENGADVRSKWMREDAHALHTFDIGSSVDHPHRRQTALEMYAHGLGPQWLTEQAASGAPSVRHEDVVFLLRGIMWCGVLWSVVSVSHRIVPCRGKGVACVTCDVRSTAREN